MANLDQESSTDHPPDIPSSPSFHLGSEASLLTAPHDAFRTTPHTASSTSGTSGIKGPRFEAPTQTPLLINIWGEVGRWKNRRSPRVQKPLFPLALALLGRRIRTDHFALLPVGSMHHTNGRPKAAGGARKQYPVRRYQGMRAAHARKKPDPPVPKRPVARSSARFADNPAGTCQHTAQP